MYTPPHFVQHDIETMQALMRSQPLATLVTQHAQGIEINHIPLLLHATSTGCGLLAGHLPRANALTKNTQALNVSAIFHGPNAYISPNWYASQAETKQFVPTWNYTAVHAHGQMKLIDSADWMREHLTQFSNALESHLNQPWSIDDAPANHIDKLLTHLIGVEIIIEKLEGKWKVSQNRPERDRHSAAAELEKTGNSNALAIAQLMRQQ